MILFIVITQLSFHLGYGQRIINGTDFKDPTPISFPGPVQGLQNKFREDLEAPECRGKTYCTVKPPDYPEQMFNEMFKGQKQLHQVTLVPDETLDNRVDASEIEGCSTKVTFHPLYRVRGSRDAEWRVVVQAPAENFIQRVRLEECSNPDEKCFSVDFGIKTFCRQKYSHWEFLVAAENGTEKINAELPVCCSCNYSFE